MSIYDEAFNDLLKYFHENKPLENIDDTLVKIERGLERAKKEHELLKSYEVLTHDYEQLLETKDMSMREWSLLRFNIIELKRILEKELNALK